MPDRRQIEEDPDESKNWESDKGDNTDPDNQRTEDAEESTRWEEDK